VVESPRRGRNVEELSPHPTPSPPRGEGIWISFTPHPFPLPIRRGEECRVVGAERRCEIIGRCSDSGLFGKWRDAIGCFVY